MVFIGRLLWTLPNLCGPQRIDNLDKMGSRLLVSYFLLANDIRLIVYVRFLLLCNSGSVSFYFGIKLYMFEFCYNHSGCNKTQTCIIQ